MSRAELRLPDWPFGAQARRRLLEALLLEPQPPQGWTKTELERRADVGVGGLDEVLGGAVQLGLLLRDGDVWRRADPLPTIASPLKTLVERARGLPNDRIKPPPTRAYRRRSG